MSRLSPIDHYPAGANDRPERHVPAADIAYSIVLADPLEADTARVLAQLREYQVSGSILTDEAPAGGTSAGTETASTGDTLAALEDISLTDYAEGPDISVQENTTTGLSSKETDALETSALERHSVARHERTVAVLGPPAVEASARILNADNRQRPDVVVTDHVDPAREHRDDTNVGAAGVVEEGTVPAGGRSGNDRPPGGSGRPPGPGGEKDDDGSEDEPYHYALPLNFAPQETTAENDGVASDGETVFSGDDERTVVRVQVTDRATVGWNTQRDEPLYGRRVTASVRLHTADGRLVAGRQTTEDLPYDSDDPEIARRADPQQTSPERLAQDFARGQIQEMTAAQRPETRIPLRPAFADIMQLNPRQDKRDETLETLAGKVVLGVEVTDSVLARACAVGNIDPQHSSGRPDLSAIEAVAKLLNGEAVAATISPDLDSIGSLAVLAIAIDIIARDRSLEGPVLERIGLIGSADRFEKGEWPGARPLPTMANLWSEIGTASELYELAAMAAVVRDFKLPLEERVALLKHWLTTGEEPLASRDKATAERQALIRSLETHETTIGTTGDGRVAAVTSPYFAIGLGYHRAPVVVALNPAFQFRGGEPHAKMTIAQFTDQYVDLQAVFAELNVLEAAAQGIPPELLKNRWAGSPTIGGSPQGESTMLSIEQVAEVVAHHPASSHQ